MSYPCDDKKSRLMQIGLIAYGMDGHDPSKVLVRVPTERGRWVLTDRCVVEVACPYCKAVIGEPCRRGKDHIGHGAGTHARRRDEWQKVRYRERKARPLPKLRVPAGDFEAAGEVLEEGD